VLVKKGNLAHASFPLQWNDVIIYALFLMQEGNIACASFPPRWNDVIEYILVLVQEPDFPHNGMMFDMQLCKTKS
jgi:hypothetical protein